jgi:hypothetical protein
MKRKTVFLLSSIVLVLLAVYGVWHYSPLRYLTRSKSQPDLVHSGTIKSHYRPVIVTKKILPDSAQKTRATDIPRPLVVLKDLPAKKTPQPDQPREKSADQADAEKKTLVLQPDGSLLAKKTGPSEIKPDASAKTVPDKPQVGSLKPEPYHPYSILLSSCRLPQSARKIVSDYQKVGLTPYVVKVKFDEGDEWLRVLAGHYQTRREALKIKKDHQLSAAIVKKMPYTNFIGMFAAEEEAMQDDLSRLRKLGYSPYFLKTQNGRYKLVVGAFITKQGAENQSKELQSKGIPNKVIKR